MTKDLTVAERLLVDNALDFINSMTIKNPNMASKYETTDSIREGNYFVLANNHLDECEFSTFTYTEEDFYKVGVTDTYRINSYLNNYSLVPKDLQEKLFNNKVDYYVNDYEELNDYYREIHGQPPIDYDSSDYILTSIGKYVHELTDKEYYQLFKSGEIDNIIEAHSTERYLKYLDPNVKVDYLIARSSNDFYILNYDKNLMEELYVKQIVDYYYEILVYTLAVIYTKSFDNQTYYDSFIIIYMLTATLQKFFANHITNLMHRDVYDIDSLRNIFYSYGLPFYEEIPLKYQQKIVKNINRLLAYKGTDTIFVDIASIFGFDDTEIYKYYLVKDYERKADGTIAGDINDLDNIELKFAQVSVEEKDISSYLNTDFLYQSYEDVVSGDPYWGMNDAGEIDTDLINEIKQYDFNYIATKYLSVSTIFNLSQSVFETNYFFNMLDHMYKEGLLDKLNFYNSTLKPSGEEVNVFSVVTGIYILLFRRFGYSDLIQYTPINIASVYGFNFDANLDILKEVMHRKSKVTIDGKDLYYWDDDTIESFTKVLEMPNNPSKADLINTYFTNYSFNDSLKNAINNTSDLTEYRALNAIYTYNMYSQTISNLYGNKNRSSDEYATYTEWLRANDIDLSKWIDSNSLDEYGNINKEATIKALDTLLEALDLYFNSRRFTNLFLNTNVTLDLVKQYFIQVISIFKAYTVDIKKINIYYMLDDKYLNTIRLFTYINKSAHFTLGDSLEGNDIYDEVLKNIKLYLNENDLSGLYTYLDTIISVFKEDRFIHLRDKMTMFTLMKSSSSLLSLYSYMDMVSQETLSNQDLLKDFKLYFEERVNLLKRENVGLKSSHLLKFLMKKAALLSIRDETLAVNVDKLLTSQDLLEDFNSYVEYRVEFPNKDDIEFKLKLLLEYIMSKSDALLSITDEKTALKKKFISDIDLARIKELGELTGHYVMLDKLVILIRQYITHNNSSKYGDTLALDDYLITNKTKLYNDNNKSIKFNDEIEILYSYKESEVNN
jgi:hypothetical protein